MWEGGRSECRASRRSPSAKSCFHLRVAGDSRATPWKVINGGPAVSPNMKFPRKIVGRTSSERETNSAALVDEVPAAGVRVDDAARDAMAAQLLREQTRRDALRLGVAAGGGGPPPPFAGRVLRPGAAPPRGPRWGNTISNTDIDAKRIAAC